MASGLAMVHWGSWRSWWCTYLNIWGGERDESPHMINVSGEKTSIIIHPDIIKHSWKIHRKNPTDRSDHLIWSQLETFLQTNPASHVWRYRRLPPVSCHRGKPLHMSILGVSWMHGMFPGDVIQRQRVHMVLGKEKNIWLVISTPLKNISQVGWLFPIWENKRCSKPPTRYGYWCWTPLCWT